VEPHRSGPAVMSQAASARRLIRDALLRARPNVIRNVVTRKAHIEEGRAADRIGERRSATRIAERQAANRIEK
jgi:hypothetical protein